MFVLCSCSDVSHRLGAAFTLFHSTDLAAQLCVLAQFNGKKPVPSTTSQRLRVVLFTSVLAEFDTSTCALALSLLLNKPALTVG